MYSRAVNAFSATRPGSWLVGLVAAIDVDDTEPDAAARDRQWPALVRATPHVRTDERRTTRDIPVVRLVAR